MLRHILVVMATNHQTDRDLAIEGDNNNLMQLLRETEDVPIHHTITLVVDIVIVIINIMIIITLMVIRDTRIDKVGIIIIFVHCALSST